MLAGNQAKAPNALCQVDIDSILHPDSPPSPAPIRKFAGFHPLLKRNSSSSSSMSQPLTKSRPINSISAKSSDGPITPTKMQPRSQPQAAAADLSLTGSSPLSPLPDNEDIDAIGEDTILHTPRRGRRMAGIQMGWESPSYQLGGDFHHTLPRAAINRHMGFDVRSTTATSSPLKRKAGEDSPLAQTPTRKGRSERGGAASLIDSEGYASAAFSATKNSKQQRRQRQQDPSASPHFEAAPTARARFHHLAAFEAAGGSSTSPPSSTASSSTVQGVSKLVAVEVKGMGRVAVDKDMAVQLGAMTEEQLKASQAQLQSDDLYSSGSQDAKSTSSYGSSSTQPSSLDTPAYSSYSSGGIVGPSPSFSLKSTFPASEEGSPLFNNFSRSMPTLKAKTLDAGVLQRVKAFKQKLTANRTAQTSSLESSFTFRRGVPRLGGSASVATSRLPQLDWPDSASGPWSEAGHTIKTEDKSRLDVVRRWLDDDADETWVETQLAEVLRQAPSSSISAPQHPMVAKVVRDRNRKSEEVLAGVQAAKMSLQATPRRRRGRASKRHSRHLMTTPRGKAKRSILTPSSLGRSVITGSGGAMSSSSVAVSVIGCNCGLLEDDLPMVQCDSCHQWYHMRCAGITRPDELEETWFCRPCELEPSRADLSPASTLTLAPAPSTGGSFPSETPDLMSVHAFPRAYASHIGVATPSAAYSRGSHMPVLIQADSPMYSRLGADRSAVGLSTSLALAPSPNLEAGDGSSARKTLGQGRARASRIGWHAVEPSSPLDRKSAATFTSFNPSTTPGMEQRWRNPSASGSAQRQVTSHARGHYAGEENSHHVPSMVLLSPTFGASARRRASANGVASNRTPSPSPMRQRDLTVSTPSRHAGASHTLGTDADDVFSTPSRHLPGSSWWAGKNPSEQIEAAFTPTHLAVAGFDSGHVGMQTPSRSTRRRQSSGWALNFATPGSARDRDLLFGSGVTEVSSGAYSSGGIPGLTFSSGSGIDVAATEDFPGASWAGSSSPTMRSAHRRQRSTATTLLVGRDNRPGVGGGSSSILNSQASTSNLRSGASTPSSQNRRLRPDSDYYEEESHAGDLHSTDPPTSSSPYPRTPSLDMGFSSAARLGRQNSDHLVTPGSPTPSRGKLGALGPNRRSDAGSALAEALKGGSGASQNQNRRSNVKDPLDHHQSQHSLQHLPLQGQGNGPSGRTRQVSFQHPGQYSSQHDANSLAASHFGLGLGLDIDDVLDFF